MKRLLLAIFLVILSVGFVFSQNVSVSDYQVPVSSAKNLLLNANWNWAQTGDTVTTNNMSGAVFFRTFYSSLPFAWFIDADGAANRSLGNKWQLQTNLSGRVNKYVWDDQDWFGFGRARVRYERPAVGPEWDQPASDLTIGAGYGRFINATALAKAVRIEGHLLKEGVIKNHMPKEIMIEVANIIEREGEYKDLYGATYEVQWFKAIEEKIKESGELIGEHLGAMGFFRTRQVLFNIQEKVNDRYYGWDLSAGVLFELTKPFKSQEIGSPQLTIIGNYAYPIDWSMQLNAKAEASTPIDSNFFKQTNISVGTDFIYELSNKINWVTGYRLGLLKKPNVDAQTTHNLSSSFLFYLENQIYYGVTGSLSKIGDNATNLGISMSLQYRLF
ncbi:MAG: hypothetical protein KJ963_02690 [Bacteroidetes bacterium]|nr:hypothetical protein [Bacteroidota bacterium]